MIYKLDNTPISDYGAIAVLNGERIAIGGIFDCPKRKSPTERSWDTSIEPFVDQEDIELEGRDLSLKFVLRSIDQISDFKNALISCTHLMADDFTFNVICKEKIEVEDFTGTKSCFTVSAKFFEENVIIPSILINPINLGNIRIDGFDLQSQFGIHGNAFGGFRSIGSRLEVNTTETYTNTEFRDYRELSINCFMLGTSIIDLMAKMKSFQALLLAPGMRTLYIDGDSYTCYFKTGFNAKMVIENLIQFTLKLSTND